MINLLFKVINNFHKEGMFNTFKKVINYKYRKKKDNKFIKDKLVKKSEIEKQKNYKFEQNYLISIVVPLYKTPTRFLVDLIDSVIAQTYQNWEICLADGSGDNKLKEFICSRYIDENRIIYKLLKDNYGISRNTNKAIEISKGDIIVFIDHDDFIEPNALFEINKVFNNNEKTELVYTDEDLTDSKGAKYFSPRIKPGFNIDLLRNVNYICHMVALKRELLIKVGFLNEKYDGAQDFEFLLRCAENTKNIEHINKILYHWRSHGKSTATNNRNKRFAIEAAINALKDHYTRVGIEADVKYTGNFIVLKTKFYNTIHPLVSIVILNSGDFNGLKTYINSLVAKTNYDNYEIIIVDKSDTIDFVNCYESLLKENNNVRIVQAVRGSNYSELFNYGCKYANGEYLLLLNSYVEVITNNYLEQLLGINQRKDIGAVSGKILYKDNLIHNAGVIINNKCDIELLGRGEKNNYKNDAYGINISRDVDATYQYFTFLSKESFELAGAFDENYDTEYSNYDLCLKIKKLGLVIVYLPNIEVLTNKKSKLNSDNDREKFVNRWTNHVC